MKSILLKSTLIFFSILLTSCGVNKVKHKLMADGTVAQEHYYTEIPFEKKLHLMVVEAQINGVKGSFIVDTGAPNTISLEFASRLKLKTVTSGYINDSGGKSQEQNYVSLGEVQIGTVTYNNLAAVIMDMKSSSALACFQVDGIIGSNLLRLSVFHIDNQKQKIVLTDAISRISIPENTTAFDFESDRSGIPYVTMEVDGVKAASVTFDTGSTGKLSFNKDFSSQFLEKNIETPKVALKGMASYGMFGKHDLRVIYEAKVKDIHIGKFKTDEKYILLNRIKNILGNSFLSHYNVTVDWSTKTIALEKIKAFDAIAINNFGFNATVRDKKVFVAGIYEGSSARNEGLQSEDQILEVDNENFENLSSDEICDLVMSSKLLFDYPNKQQLTVTVLRNGIKKKFTLGERIVF